MKINHINVESFGHVSAFRRCKRSKFRDLLQNRLIDTRIQDVFHSLALDPLFKRCIYEILLTCHVEASTENLHRSIQSAEQLKKGYC